jgi:hypothetical protein
MNKSSRAKKVIHPLAFSISGEKNLFFILMMEQY